MITLLDRTLTTTLHGLPAVDRIDPAPPTDGKTRRVRLIQDPATRIGSYPSGDHNLVVDTPSAAGPCRACRTVGLGLAVPIGVGLHRSSRKMK